MRFIPDPSFQFANPREFKGNAIHMFLAISTQMHSSKGFCFFFSLWKWFDVYEAFKINLGPLFFLRKDVSLDKIKLLQTL